MSDIKAIAVTPILVSLHRHDADTLARLADANGCGALADSIRAELDAEPDPSRVWLTRLDAARRAAGVTWAELGSAVGKHGAHLWKYAKGRLQAPRSVAYSLSGYLASRGVVFRVDELTDPVEQGATT